jgi:serine/threonine protein phosphatase PrpC
MGETPPVPLATEDAPVSEATYDSTTEELSELEESEESTSHLTEDSVPTISRLTSVQGFAAAAMRDVGRVRENNQDSVFALITTIPSGSDDKSVGLFIVADGMGGHESGDVASTLAIRTITRHILSRFIIPAINDEMTDTMQALMVSAVEEANLTIWQHAQATNSDMGSTCTAALVMDGSVYIAHVGDSRAYVLEAETLRAVTTDHSAVGRLVELGQLDAEEARTHPLRNQLYRAIGQSAAVDVDFIYQPLANCTHLLLCSDGLWDMVPEAHMVETLTRTEWPQDVCQELVALANLNGGDDNISVVVATLPVEERLF